LREQKRVVVAVVAAEEGKTFLLLPQTNFITKTKLSSADEFSVSFLRPQGNLEIMRTRNFTVWKERALELLSSNGFSHFPDISRLPALPLYETQITARKS